MSNSTENAATPAEQKLTPPPQNVLWTAIVISIVVLGAVGWKMGVFAAPVIELSAAEAPAAPAEVQIAESPFWVEIQPRGTVPPDKRYRCAVMKNGNVFYQRLLDRPQLEKGHKFDLAVKKTGQSYYAAIEVLNDNGQPGRRVSNLLSFTH